jgi:hypothetical protein
MFATEIAKTLGMPSIPDEWSNGQVLGFVRMMWGQWLLKSGRGGVNADDQNRGPAPPAAVAAAAKIAFTTIGNDLKHLSFTEPHEIPVSEAAPVDPSSASLMERTESGTVHVPNFSEADDDRLNEWAVDSKMTAVPFVELSSRVPVVRGSIENFERRTTNLQWLRNHFRSLNDIGRLPFNNADLWQLHQYYFSPPFDAKGDGEQTSTSTVDEYTSASSPGETLGSSPHTSIPSMGRAVSFLSLYNAFAASLASGPGSNNKRPYMDSIEDESGHTAKKAKNLKPRIAYYPRIMVSLLPHVYIVHSRYWCI